MRLSTAVQMDPIDQISIGEDSTFALLLEAQDRGHDIFYYTPDMLSMLGDRVVARGWPLRVRDEPGRHFELGDEETVDLAGMDVVLLRQDPPFDMAYITTTHILERIHPRTLVVNNPQSVRNAPEKLFVTRFQDFMPETLITRSYEAFKSFRETHRDVIVKPLYGSGGTAVFRLREGDTNAGSLVELFKTVFREPFIVQRYLPEVRRGDKRIILVDGQPAGQVNRVPADDETRSNLHVGGRAEPTDLTPRERAICAAIGPELARLGLIFVGIDVIGDYLTEINVTSPTGIREIKRFGGPDIASVIWDAIEAKCRAGAPAVALS
jgi:glutathione synthase